MNCIHSRKQTRKPVTALSILACCIGILSWPNTATSQQANPEASATANADTTLAPQEQARRFEFGALPAINYNTDLGFGFGVIGSLVRFAPGYQPFRWRLELLLYATVKSVDGGGSEFPYHDDYVQLDMPGLMDGRLRLKTATGFRRFSTSGYYGLGNASQYDEDAEEENRRYHQFDRTNPYIETYGRIGLMDRSTEDRTRRLELLLGASVGYHRMRVYDDSLLASEIETAEQMDTDGQTLDDLLYGTDNHALVDLSFGLLWDTRDHEYTPTRGQFTEVSVRASPGVDESLRFAGLAIINRYFVPIYRDRVVLGTRLALDGLFGNVPVHELARFGGFDRVSGPGGGTSVRGVRLQRFYGKAKIVANAELRTRFIPFRLLSQDFELGAMLFADAGRVWADYQTRRLEGNKLDDSIGNFAVGLGAGLRLHWGETFIVRVDPAYSPTEETFGLDINVGHIF